MLSEGDFTKAQFEDASLEGARVMGAKLAGASFHNADLSKADFTRADLSEADLRLANLSGAVLEGVTLTGAKVGGMNATGAQTGNLRAEWVDTSAAGDGSGRLAEAEVAGLFSGSKPGAQRRMVLSGDRRYFGRGDVLRNATLEFGDRAKVEIDSVFENCLLHVGPGTELVVGEAGVLADCKIVGSGDITVHGQFFERESPGIVGPRALTVTSRAAMVASVEQAEGNTRFAFERGSRLRLRIMKGAQGASTQKGG